MQKNNGLLIVHATKTIIMYNPEFDKDKNQGVRPAPYADAAVNDEELTPSDSEKDDFTEDEDAENEDDLITENDEPENEEPGDAVIEEIDFEEIEIEDADDPGEDIDPENEE